MKTRLVGLIFSAFKVTHEQATQMANDLMSLAESHGGGVDETNSERLVENTFGHSHQWRTDERRRRFEQRNKEGSALARDLDKLLHTKRF